MSNDSKSQNFSDNNDAGLEEIRDNVRFQAVKILNRYERSSAYIDRLLANSFSQYSFSKPDKSLLTEIVYGTVRWKSKLDWVLTGFFHGDFNKCINPVKNAMRIGLYQILFLDRVPDHAAINESVEITKRIQSQRTAGLVNGVLRNIARNIDKIRYPNQSQDLNFYKSVYNSYQKWMVENWVAQFGVDQADQVMEAMNTKPGIAIRINRTMISKADDIAERMRNLGYELEDISGIEGCYYLKSSGEDISGNDFFKKGEITVQDPSSALLVGLASPEKGSYIADFCAAPGGKSVMMGEIMENEGKIIAFDKFEQKLPLIEENAKRMGIDIIKTIQADATTLDVKGEPDIILLDVPCSGTGTLQKHPEIKWSLEKDSIIKLNRTQRKILDNAARNCPVGGIIIYSTCSIERAENRDMVDKFLEDNEGFELVPAEEFVDKRFTKKGYMEIYPHVHGMMGAFGARLKRVK